LSILSDTSKKVNIVIQNISEMPLDYEWSFVEVVDGSADQFEKTHKKEISD